MNKIVIGGIEYPAAVAFNTPGGWPDDHVLGDWWHVDLVMHLDSNYHGEPHSLALPMPAAYMRHLILHRYMADPQGGLAYGDGGHHPEFVPGHGHGLVR